IQGSSKDSRKAEDVVELIGVVGSSRGNDPSPRLSRLLGGNLGIGICHCHHYGSLAIDLTISWLTCSATYRPMKTSAPRIASAKEPLTLLRFVRSAISFLYSFMFSERPS